MSQATASDHGWFRWFFLEAMAYSMLAQRHVAPLHAGCVARNGVGVLLCGDSGAGKSTLAFACARAGWTFVSDDASSLLQDSDDRIVIGKPHQARFRDDASRFFPELDEMVTRARPNGKLSLEVPMSAFPEIETAGTCRVGATVYLRRGRQPRIERISTEGLEEGVPADYGPEVTRRHQLALRRVLEVPVYRMDYERLEDAIEMLEGVVR